MKIVAPLRGLPVIGDAAAGVPLPADSPPSGVCPVCGGELPEIAVRHGDPFDKTRCAREFFGCQLDPKSERADQRGAA